MSPATFNAYPGATVTLSGVTFTGNGNLFAVSPTIGPGYDLGDGTVLSFQQNPTLNVLTVTLPAGTTAFGVDFGDSAPQTFTFAFTADDNSFSVSETLSGGLTPTPAFVGYTATSPFTTLTITANISSNSQIDRFTFGSAALVVVPEPGTFVLLSLGALPLAGIVARRRKG